MQTETDTKTLFDDIDSGAKFSDDRKYRFALWRIWNTDLPCVMFIGLNPSKANENEVDATIRSVIRISKHNGYGGFYMMNCWAFVATKPEDLKHNAMSDEWNDNMITVIASKCKDVVFAWGAFKIVKEKGRDKELIEMFPNAKAIGFNADGSPKHPLFIKGATILSDFHNQRAGKEENK